MHHSSYFDIEVWEIFFLLYVNCIAMFTSTVDEYSGKS